MIYLASKSPRRIELLKSITNNFEVKTFNYDESTNETSPLKKSVAIATSKANEAKKHLNNGAIITADTIVVIDNKTIGKPKDDTDAYNILKYLSGKTHLVITTYVITYKENTIIRSVTTKVTFNKLDDNIIKDYINSGSPKDKAGAYGVQDNEKYHLIKSIQGSYTNVMGFPVDEIKKDLESLKLI